MSAHSNDLFKPTFHPVYTEIASAYIDMLRTQDLTTPERQDIAIPLPRDATVDLKTYLKEYRTFSMGGPQQTGITTWAIDHSDGDSLIICEDRSVLFAVNKLTRNHRQYTGRGTDSYPCVAMAVDILDHQLANSLVFNRVYVLSAIKTMTKYHNSSPDRFFEKLSKYLDRESIIFLLG